MLSLVEGVIGLGMNVIVFIYIGFKLGGLMIIKSKKWWINQKTGESAITKGKEYKVLSRDVVIIGDDRFEHSIVFERMEEYFETMEEYFKTMELFTKIRAKKGLVNLKTGESVVTKAKEYKVIRREVSVIGDHRKKFLIDYDSLEEYFEIVEE